MLFFEILSFELLLFGILKIWILNLFRISDFEFRIYSIFCNESLNNTNKYKNG